MAEYGTLPTGFGRKELNAILGDVENQTIQTLGPDYIQTPQSTGGQFNAIWTILASALWELSEDVYQSYDPDQAEGERLDQLARIRLLSRSGRTDAELRQAITHRDIAHVGLGDLVNALKSIDDVTFAYVWTNDTGEFVPDLGNTVVPVVVGGSDTDIGLVLRRYIVPGMNSFGNYRIEFDDGGYCRSLSIIRPNIIDVTLDIYVKTYNLGSGCPSPSETSIIDNFILQWDANKLNGKDVNHYSVRTILESVFPSIEVTKIDASREGNAKSEEGVNISFIELANFDKVDINVIFVS